jgi:hypothetical protein
MKTMGICMPGQSTGFPSFSPGAYCILPITAPITAVTPASSVGGLQFVTIFFGLLSAPKVKVASQP